MSRKKHYVRQSTFKEDIDDYLKKQFNRYSDLRVSHYTPWLLQEVGLLNLPILYNQKHLKNAMKDKNTHHKHHGLSLELLYNLEELLENPVMIIDSLSRNDSVCMILDAFDKDGYPLFAAIRQEYNGSYKVGKRLKQGLLVNRLASVYGRERIGNYLTRAIEEGKILYADKEKSQALFSVLQQQFPQGFNNLDFDVIIQQSSNIVNENRQYLDLERD